MSVEFDPAAQAAGLRIDFAKGTRFACPECGREDFPVHGTDRKTRRHLIL